MNAYVGENFNDLTDSELMFISGSQGVQVQSTPAIGVSIASAALSYQISKDISGIFH